VSVSESRRELLQRLLGGGSLARAETQARVEGVQTIQAAGSKAPFIFLHGQWKMPPFFCFAMSRALGDDRPFYGVDPYDLEAAPLPPAFAAIAAKHADTVRSIRPDGPIVLGGWCNGALLAYEIARQLQAEGRKVERLVLMDPVYLRYPGSLTATRGAIDAAGRLVGAGEATRLRIYLWLRQRLRFVRHLRAYLTVPGYRRSTRLLPFGREDYPGVYDWTAMRYQPTDSYRGKTTVLWSSGQPFRSGWREYELGEECDSHVLSGTHESCLDEDLPELVEELRRSMLECP
jgi:thioesterase domain-containing protein